MPDLCSSLLWHPHSHWILLELPKITASILKLFALGTRHLLALGSAFVLIPTMHSHCLNTHCLHSCLLRGRALET